MTIRRYITGFLLALALTAASFGAVWLHEFSHHSFPTHPQLFAIILALALVQLFVQLVFFLHVGKGSKTRDLLALCFAAIIVVFIVGGTLWIMTHLMHSTMPEEPFDGSPTPQHQHGG